MIDAAALQRHVATDRYQALTPKQLTASPNILDVGEAVVVLIRPFAERRAGNPELRRLSHLSDQKLEVLGLE